MNISNSYCKKMWRITCTFSQCNLFDNLIHLSLSSIFTFIKNIFSKNLKWKQYWSTYVSWNYLPLNMGVWLGWISRRGRDRGGRRRHWWATFWLMGNSLVSFHWYDVKKREVPRSSNLNFNLRTQENVLC